MQTFLQIESNKILRHEFLISLLLYFTLFLDTDSIKALEALRSKSIEEKI